MATLQVNAHKQVLQNLGKTARGIESRFCCGGVLNSPSKVELLYKKPSGDWSQHPVVFPGANETDILNLIGVCSITSFGFDGKDAVDENYCDNLYLDPKNFMTSFQVGSTDILNEISCLMVPDDINRSSGIQAELYKLNIYSKGGRFKAHVDSDMLHSSLMFGSLVLCLPLPFTGGSLVTRHQGRQICFDWSSPETTNDKICWASFFNDVKHEVLPVTSGHRVTLTYNLYHNFEMEKVSMLDVTTVPFYTELYTALQTPHFMREGGILGFGCQHAYVMKDLNETKSLSEVLRGSDRIVYNVSKSLSLSVAIAELRGYQNETNWSLLKQDRDVAEPVTCKGGIILYRKAMKFEDMTWCHDLIKWDSTEDGAIAFLVEIPKWNPKRGTSHVSDETELERKDKKRKIKETNSKHDPECIFQKTTKILCFNW